LWDMGTWNDHVVDDSVRYFVENRFFEVLKP